MFFRTVNMPVCWLGNNEGYQAEADKMKAELEECVKEGYKLTHITSSVIDGIMFVYYVFQKENI